MPNQYTKKKKLKNPPAGPNEAAGTVNPRKPIRIQYTKIPKGAPSFGGSRGGGGAELGGGRGGGGAELGGGRGGGGAEFQPRAKIMETEGHKDDAEKIRYDLIPAGPLHLLACLYTFGAVKYADENWRKGISFKRLFGALMRHAWAWMRGENVDLETGLPHMVAVAWCAFSIVELQLQHKNKNLDDRFIPPELIRTQMFESIITEMRARKK